MNKADAIFQGTIEQILGCGYWDENPRAKYEDGTPAYSKFITQVFESYDLSRGQFPITTLRPIPIINGIKEIRWIYQDQTSSLDVLRDKYNIHWWDDWKIDGIIEYHDEYDQYVANIDDNIGIRYGATVNRYDLMNKLLHGLVNNPYGRRHILSLWQEKDFRDSDGLPPCAFQTMFSVRKVNDDYYLDMTLIQRSSDYLVAGHINKMQYVAFMMMVAKHCGYKVGNFCHFVQNLHIYDRHMDQAIELLARTPSKKNPTLILDVPDGTNFYEITEKDFSLIEYDPVRPQLTFELGV